MCGLTTTRVSWCDRLCVYVYAVLHYFFEHLYVQTLRRNRVLLWMSAHNACSRPHCHIDPQLHPSKTVALTHRVRPTFLLQITPGARMRVCGCVCVCVPIQHLVRLRQHNAHTHVFAEPECFCVARVQLSEGILQKPLQGVQAGSASQTTRLWFAHKCSRPHLLSGNDMRRLVYRNSVRFDPA